MSEKEASPLTYELLKQAVAGQAAAIRCKTKLQPAAGPGTKVFPPTHSGGVYATEKRRLPVEGKPGETREADCVLLDSVQSQANRIEDALQAAIDNGELSMPLIVVEFGDAVADIQRVTSLQAPHRAADAILRDSLLGGEPFRKSAVGEAITNSSLANATGLFRYCPHALFLGVWDSTGPKGGLGAKFARALVSEIVGIDASFGVRTGSRIDPLQITKNAGPLYRRTDGSWTINPDEGKQKLVKDKPTGEVCLYKQIKNKDAWHEPGPLFETDSGDWTYLTNKARRLSTKDGIATLQLFDKKTFELEERLVPLNLLSTKVPDAGRPSTANHGNVTPDLVKYEDAHAAMNPLLAGVNSVRYRFEQDANGIRVQSNTDLVEEVQIKSGQIAAGGVTLDHAEHTAVLSFPQLRRLRFPLSGAIDKDPKKQIEIDNAARTVLAGLALVGLTLSLERGCDLRSRCLLFPSEAVTFELLDKPGENKQSEFTLTSKEAIAIYGDAVKHATSKEIGLTWSTNEIELTPSPDLIALVKKSQELAAVGIEDEKGAG